MFHIITQVRKLEKELLRVALYTAWGCPEHRPDSCPLSPRSGPTVWTFFGPNLVPCKVMRPDSRARWSRGLSFMKFTMVNAWCFWQLSFTTLTMGDDLYRVVVSKSKLGPNRLNQGLWIFFRRQNAPINLSTMFNELTDGYGLGGTPNFRLTA